MRTEAMVLAVTLVTAPLGAQAADVVVSWHKAHHAEEDKAIREVVAAFEQETGKQVEVTLLPMAEQPPHIEAALDAAHPPDFAFGFWLDTYVPKWGPRESAGGSLGHRWPFLGPVRSNQLDRAMLLNARTGERALYGLPMGQISNYIHVWESLLERAGLSHDDIPKEWEPFWSFWCDQVQPAVRKALGRDDIWGIGRPMSVEAADTTDRLRLPDATA
jgi:multiple sugar transport system substrate-binding protein